MYVCVNIDGELKLLLYFIVEYSEFKFVFYTSLFLFVTDAV